MNTNELRYLTSDYKIAPQGISRRYNALMWNEKFTESGVFELHTYEDLTGVQYILNTNKQQLAIIMEEDTTHKEKRIYRGELLTRLIADYVIANTETFYNKTPAQIVMELYSKYYPGNIEIIDNTRTQLDPVTVQVTGDNLLDYIYTILNPHNMTIQGCFNTAENSPYFEIIESENNVLYDPLTTENGTVISFSQVAQFYTQVNYAVVDGEIADDGNRVKVLVDKRASTNDAMRQIYVDARDVQSKYVDGDGEVVEVSAGDYNAMLTQRGTEKIAAEKRVDTVVASAGVILSLGEIRVVKTHNREYTLRANEILTSYEKNSVRLDQKYGTIN